MTYWQLRMALLRHPISAALAALNQSGLFVLTIMGTALPAVFFLILLNFGILLDHNVDASERLPILLHLILLQILWMGLMRDAILGMKAKLLLRSVPGHHAHQRVSMLLASMVNPLLWPPLVILLGSAPSAWPALAPQWLLPLLLLALQWCCLFAPAGALLYLQLIFGLSLLDLTPQQADWLLSLPGMISLLLLLLVCQRLPTRSLTLSLRRLFSRLPVPVFAYLAQAMITEALHGLVLRLTLALLTIAAGHLVQSQVADFAGAVQTVTVSLLGAIAASWQFPLNRFLSDKGVFLASLPKQFQTKMLLLGQPLALGLLMFQFWQYHGEHCWLQLGLFCLQLGFIQYVTLRVERQYALATLLAMFTAIGGFLLLAN